MAWSYWGESTAFASGQLVRDTCRPDCVEGINERCLAAVLAQGFSDAGHGVNAYSMLYVTAPNVAGLVTLHYDIARNMSGSGPR